jgi:capsular polysaccharide transport system permease protein
VIFALFIRELKTRFGAYRLGLLWAFLEPTLFVIMISAIRSFRSYGGIFGGEAYGIPYPIFFMLGIVPYKCFSSQLTQGAAAVRANQGLFTYRQVRPIDALIARTLLEILIYSSVFLIFMTVFWWFGFAVSIAQPLKLIGVFILLTLLGSGMGLIICVGQLRIPELSKITPLLIRPLFFISGIFFSINEIPAQYQHYLLWNPMLHAIELIRNACYSSYNVDLVSWGFLAISALVTSFFGLAMYRLDWKQMVAS